jgi:LmbE family N-acetylglucosaminyl deacetylase
MSDCVAAARGRRLVLVFALSSLSAMSVAPSSAAAKNILVVGAHPDDEILMAAGRSRTALLNGDSITVVVVTNGDFTGGTATGIAREGQSVSAAQALGLVEHQVVFLGYPDGSMRTIYDATSGTQVFTSAAGQTATYGTRGLGGMDYHHYLYGVAGPYSRDTVIGDLQAVMLNFQPDEIYTHSDFETHPDHVATSLFVTEALVSLKRSGVDLRTKLYHSIVWMPGAGSTVTPNWPQLTSTGWTPYAPFLAWSSPCTPGDCTDLTQMEWERAIRFVQPAEMQSPDQTTNLKSIALSLNGGTAPWFLSFVRKDEFFWLEDFGVNLATTAQVTASSENAAGGQGALKAVDGVISGEPSVPGAEWASNGELGGAWIQLAWASPVRIAQVNLYDRPNATDNILAGTLTFSDGSSIAVGAPPANGRVLPVTFAPKTVTWVRFTIDQAVGNTIGLSEIQVLGAPASSTADHAPYFIRGPVAASNVIPASQSTAVTATAWDPDGDPLQVQWSVDGGFIWQNGSSATFVPPPVVSDTYFTITVQVSDGRGGTATNSTFVRVTPAPTDSVTVSPSNVFGGDPALGTIVLGAAPPTGGAVVPLASTNPAVGVPASVTVPAGATTATFPIATSAVATTTPVLVTAAFAGGMRAAALTLSPQSVTSLTLSPASVLSGNASQGTVVLPAPAGPQGVAVQLSSSDPATATVPATVSFAAGASSATFPIATAAGITVTTQVTLSATYGTTATAVLAVGPLAVSVVALAPATVVGGSPSQATVMLNGPATGGGAVVALSSSNPSVATVPASVTVPAGASSATFTVATASVATSTSVSIAASFLGSSISTPLTVTPYVPPPPGPNLLSNAEQIGAAPWNVAGDLALTLNAGMAPDGSQRATRAVSSGGGHALSQMVAVTPGATYTFSVFARNHGGRAASYSVYDNTHFADIVPATSYFGLLNDTFYTRVSVTFTVPPGCTTIAVYPLRDSGRAVDVLLWGAKLEIGSTLTSYGQIPPAIASMTVSPANILGGTQAQGTVILPLVAGTQGAVVQLASSDASLATVPASVTIPANAATATFPITTLPSATPKNVTLSATYGTTATAVLTVGPLALSTLALVPSSVVGGSPTQATVTLNGPADPSGDVIALTSSDPSVTVPATVTIPAGASNGTFSVSTSAVAVPTPVTLTAAFAGSSASAVLTVTPYVPPPPNPNLLANPEQIGAVPWTVLGDLATTLNFATSPDGTMHATRAVSSGGGHALPQIVPVAPGTTYTFSFYARNNGGTGASYSVYDNTNFADVVPPTPYLSRLGGTGFTRVGVTFTTPAGCTAVAVYPLRDSGSAVDLLLWGAKLEVGATMTAYQSPGAGSLTVSPPVVGAGASAQGAVLLSGAAPAGGTTVPLASSNTAVATVPATVTVPAGATTASFLVTTGTVATTTTVTVSATFAAGTQSASLTVTPPPVSVSSIALTPTSVTGGTPSSGTVALNVAAPPGGVAVALASDSAAATVPASVTIPAGATTGAFTVSTSGVAARTVAHLSASSGGTTLTATLSLNPPAVAQLAVSPASVAGGNASTGTVTLTGPAPAGGASVTLSSDNTSAATVPASVTVGAGATSATFPVSTSVVEAPTTANLAATYGGATATAALSVTSAVVSALALTPTSVVGGSAATGTVTLNGPAPLGGVAIALSSSNPAAATVPASVTVAGGATTATFTVTTSQVATSTSVIVSASYGPTVTATLTVSPLTASGLALTPTSVVGGISSTGTVTLTGPAPAGGVVVTLSSSNTSVAAVPASVPVAAGATTATFTVTTVPIATSTTATISATYGAARSATLTVNPLALSGLSLSPATVVGGASSTGTVALNAAAPAGGTVVTLSDNGPSATVPGSVTVPAGATSATFTITTVPVTASTPVTVTATLGASSRNATLTINAASLSSFAMSPTSVLGGNSSTGTVTLNSAAPAGGVTVALSAANAAVTVPATVTVAAGATRATFTATTTPVAANTAVTVTGVLGTTRTATLTVTAPTLTTLALSPAILAGGGTSTGSVTLSGPAAAAGVTVALTSNNTVATVPATVTVSAGATSATFPISSTVVSANTNVTISARLGATTRNATLSVRVLAVSALSLSPNTVVGGTPSTGTVTLTAAALPGGFTVSLTSSRTTVATVPSTVVIPAGSTTAAFSITSSMVTANTSSTISASGGSVTRSATLTVTP